MRSTFAGFNTVVRGISANQIGIDTSGHNVTNANTDGYSRQNVNLVTTDPQKMYGENGTYEIGTGVSVASITRARNTLLDKQYWKETSTYTYNQNTEELLGKIESAFGEPSDTGIQTVLNTFWSSWQTLGSNASDEGSRTAVREKGVALVNSIQASAKQLKNMVNDINDEIEKQVNTVNQYTDEISQLNRRIFSIEAGGNDHANDLRDRRDYLCDQLSTIIDTHVTEDVKGNYIVQTGSGYVLADSSSSTNLAVVQSKDADYGYMMDQVKLAGTSPVKMVEFKNGKIKSLLDVRDSETGGVKGYLNNLSNMSKFLLQDFNEAHRQGYGSDNSTNNNFFGAEGMDYNSNAITGYTKDDWINKLCVCKELFANGGTAKIAAKSSGASIGVKQYNSTGSTAAVFATGTYTNGTVPTNVTVRVVDPPAGSTGKVNKIQYSTDDGVTWSAAQTVTAANASKSVCTLAGINGLDVQMYFDATNTNNTYGDIYKFALTNHSADSNMAVSQKNSTSGAASILSATGSYSGGDTATSVIVRPFAGAIDTTTNSLLTPPTVLGKVRTIQYSTDGGTTWTKANVTSDTESLKNSTFALSIGGVNLNMQIATNSANSSSDEYYFTVSKGNVASGDNAVLMSKKLKTDTSSTIGNMSLDGYYSSVIGSLGVQREDAQRSETNQKTLLTQIDNMRQAVAGVSLDEEMSKMIQYQKGYNAAARMLTTMNDMLDTLLSSVR